MPKLQLEKDYLMGRQRRNDADYFPHFAEPGKTLHILKGRWGNNGYAFWFQLLEVLCRSDNHFYDCSHEADWQYLLSRTGVDEITGAEILGLLANLGKIDPELWGHRIIWCENLVANIAEVYRKRGRDVPSKPTPARTKEVVSGAEKTEPATDTEITGAEIPQTILKDSKVKDSRGKQKPYGEFQNVLLTDEEYTKLHERFNQETHALIERLSTYIASTGKKYKSHYATIISWQQKDEKEGRRGKTRHSRELPKVYTKPPDYPEDR